MKLKLLALVIALALIASSIGLGTVPIPVHAKIDNVEAAVISCTEFGAAGYFSSGDGTPRKVGIYAYNITTGQELGFRFINQGVSGSYGGTMSFAEQPANSWLYVDISTYPLSATSFADWDFEQYAYGIVNCSDSGFTGPSVPSGAELKTITCDVAVFDEPGGQPVGDNRIKAGQTWYVIPGVKADSTGQNWVQVFVSGFGLPWIPARCVPGADTTKAAKPASSASTGSVLTTASAGGLKRCPSGRCTP
ncbi:MAG: hypothetical protein KF716_27255 [Anaerolineae bacterium]|nr:hypothetical protein [Anaerolineae bacterium]